MEASPIISVQELVKKTKTTIPQNFVVLGQEPSTNIFNSHTPLPIIDMAQLVSSFSDDDLEVQRLHSTCKNWGFFQLVNHGVEPSLLERLKHDLEEFYELPLDEKAKYNVRPGEFEGYGGATVRSGRKMDWGDRFYMLTNPIHRRKQHLLPELPSSFRHTLEEYCVEMQKLGMKLLDFLAKALKMERKEMEEMFEDGMQSVRMTYYPPCSNPDLVVGITPHSDATGITILNQVNGVDGLEIIKDGVWVPVSFLPNSFVINVGDILEIMSNELYKSVEHKVRVNTSKERISFAFFINPKFEAKIGPALSLLGPRNPPRYKNITMEQYVKDFFARTLNGKSYLELMKIKDENEIN